MKITIIGVGALACALGARLAPNAAITLLGRWPAQVDAIRERGLTLIDLDGSVSQVSIDVTSDAAAQAASDMVIVAVKSGQTPDIVESAALELTADGLCLTLQNGLGNWEMLRAALGQERVTAGATTLGARVREPGVVQLAGAGYTRLGRHELLGAAQRGLLDDTCSLMNQSDLPAEVTDHVDSLLWTKLVANAAINPVTALLRVPNGRILEDERLIALVSRLAREAAAVAAAQAIGLPYPDAAAYALQVARDTAANQSSMLQDIARGQRTEVDAINGAVVAAGARLGVPTPANLRMLGLMHRLEVERQLPVASGDVDALIAAMALAPDDEMQEGDA